MGTDDKISWTDNQSHIMYALPSMAIPERLGQSGPLHEVQGERARRDHAEDDPMACEGGAHERHPLAAEIRVALVRAFLYGPRISAAGFLRGRAVQA